MELFAKIELDPGELWEEEIKGSVDELLQEEIPGYFCEIEGRAEWLEEKFGELNYRVDELEDHETEDHEDRLTELESQEDRLTELESQVEELTEQLERIKQLIPRDIIESIVRDLLGEAKITI